ncbi:MAG: hypothetical protein ACK469_04780, partial [Bacteroidota bacterium]
ATLNFVLSGEELVITSSPPQHLEPLKNAVFKIREFSDRTIEFIVDKTDVATGLRLTSGGKAIEFTKK